MTEKEAQEQPEEAQELIQEEHMELESVNIERKREASDKQRKHMEHMRQRRAEVQQQKKVEQLVQEKIEANSIKDEPTEALFGLLELTTIGVAVAGAAAFYLHRQFSNNKQQPTKPEPKPTPVPAKRTTDALFDNY